MPSHQERREPLPKGYQFGDARRDPSVIGRSGAMFIFEDETQAERFRELTVMASRSARIESA